MFEVYLCDSWGHDEDAAAVFSSYEEAQDWLLENQESLSYELFYRVYDVKNNRWY